MSGMTELPQDGGSLAEGDVHLWYVSLDEVQASPKMWDVLSREEQERSYGFCLERGWRRFVVGRAFLRGILAQYSRIPPNEVPLASGSCGKPSLGGSREARRIRFNLSHSAGLALYAVTLDRDIGVDLENVTQTAGLEGIAARLFSKSERAYVDASRGVFRARAFFRIWTRREALVKGMGRGLLGLSELNRADCDCSQKSSRTGDWRIEGLDHCSGFEAAVALAGPVNRITTGEIARVPSLELDY